MFDFPTLFDFFGSLAILAMLSSAYGNLHRLLGHGRMTEPVLGLMFGLVTLVQMHSPLNLAPGLIVDMRYVAIVAAGAFLGGRGLIPCILIAAAARFHIGGVGATSAVAAMLIAGGVGLVWSGLTAGKRRGLRSFLVLAAVTPIHLLGVILLPYDVALTLLSKVGLPLVGLYLISVPIVALLLDQARQTIARERAATDARACSHGKSLMSRDALEWSLAQSAETGSLSQGASIISMRIRFKGALARFWGHDADRVAMQVFHHRLQSVMPQGGVVGWAREDLVLMAVPTLSAEAARLLLTRIRREVSSDAIAESGMVPFRLVLDLDVFHHDDLPPLECIIDRILARPADAATLALPTPSRPRARAARDPGRPRRSGANTAALLVVPPGDGDLFGRYDAIRTATHGKT